MNWNCPWCGCRTYHYNSERGRNECDGCGTPVTSEEEETWRNQYEQQILRARAHLEVANWIQAVDLLEPLTRQSPTDKRLYRMLLQAATKDYQDMQMQNRRLRQIAADAWEKLERLGGLEDQMIRYGKASREKYIESLKRRRNYILMWFALLLGCFLIFPGTVNQASREIGLLLFGIMVWSTYRMIDLRPLRLANVWKRVSDKPTENPFIRQEVGNYFFRR